MKTNHTITKILQTEEDLQSLASKLANLCSPGCNIFLEGQLGAGKTSFVRGFLRALGYKNTVKSPTYTLVEPYKIKNFTVYHFDLYRLRDSEELEFMGARDYFTPESICLVEWPEKGEGWLPEADITCRILIHGEGREVILSAQSTLGQKVLQQRAF